MPCDVGKVSEMIVVEVVVVAMAVDAVAKLAAITATPAEAKNMDLDLIHIIKLLLLQCRAVTSPANRTDRGLPRHAADEEVN